MRFAVRLGLDSTFAPAAQTACSVQNVFPSSLWNSVGPQATQLSAFDSPEYCPVGHCKHRSGVLLVVSESYSPGTQLIFTLQNGWPLSNCYLPSGHETHEAVFDKLLNLPATHASQARFDVAVGVAFTSAPAAQTACSAQNVLPSSLWNSVAPHAMQPGALLSPEYCPDGHSRQRSGVLLVLSLSY